MKLLVDTQLLLWAAGMPDKLSAKARELLEDPQNILFYSVASLWEVVIKNGLGRSDFAVDPHLLRRGLVDNGWQELPIEGSHVLAVSRLPTIHKDPFDRVLVAQAQVEGFLLLTTDVALGEYLAPVKVL